MAKTVENCQDLERHLLHCGRRVAAPAIAKFERCCKTVGSGLDSTVEDEGFASGRCSIQTLQSGRGVGRKPFGTAGMAGLSSCVQSYRLGSGG